MSNLSVKPFSSFARRTAKWVFDSMPSWELKKGKVLNGIKWAGQHISSPQNRVILGATALMSQPFIDLHNKRVDEETRKVSAARTTAKIIAGTTTGFLVRYYAIKAVEKFTQNPIKAEKAIESFFFPKGIAHTTVKGLQQHKFTIGTFLSLGIMLFTNFAIDAPLTKYLTNHFVKRINEHEKNKLDKEIAKPVLYPNVEKNNLVNNSMTSSYIPRVSIEKFKNGKGAE